MERSIIDHMECCVTWNFVGLARVHVEECSYLLTRDLDTVVVACINNHAYTLVMYIVSHARCKMQTAASNAAAHIIL